MRNAPPASRRRQKLALCRRHKLIGIAVHGSQSAHRTLIRGILNYRTAHQCQWKFPFPDKHEPNLDRTVTQLNPIDYDGVIGIFWEHREYEIFREKGVHCVNILSHFTHPELMTISSDDFAIGKMVGEHFARESIEQAWYYGPCDENNGVSKIGEQRFLGLLAACQQAGLPAPIKLPFKLILPIKRKSSLFLPSLRKLREILQMKNTKRIGLFLFSDSLINESVSTLLETGIRIPEEAVVASVDNDSIFCNLPQLSVTSVNQDTERVGYLAAEMMDKLLRGETLTSDHVVVPPLQLNIRQSSDLLETNDPRVQAALSSIRNRLGQRLTVQDLLQASKVSRRTLEQAFQSALGCSPYQAILQSRITYSKQLLKQSKYTVEAIAIESGFQSLTRFNQAFSKSEGITPGAWRRMHYLNAHHLISQ